MNEDRSRDGAQGRAPHSGADGGADGGADPGGDGSDVGGAQAQVDDVAARYRAEKRARVHARREEMRRRRQAADSLPATPAGDRTAGEPGGARGKAGRGSALPALTTDIRPDTPALRAERVEAIRRDLVRRRRRKGLGTLLRLLVFVMIPTTLVGGFLYAQASDLYESESSFAVKSAEAGPTGSGGLLGGLLGGGGLIYDPIAVQTYLTSRDVLRRLNADHDWIAHFQNPALDIYHRLAPTATFEEAFRHYLRFVTVSYDPTEGIVKLSLVASTPEDAHRFSVAIITYAEETVDKLSERIRKDALTESEAYFAEAEANLRTAQLALAAAQKLSEVFSVESEVAAQMALITQLETQREEAKSRLASLLRVTSDDDPRITRRRAALATLELQIRDLRDQIAGRNQAGQTLADVNARMLTAKLEVETKMAIFTSALQRLEVARSEAARQHRYLAIVSSPSLPDRANYPKKLEMTALAFLGFLGFYIIGSLTISLIREQASI